MSEPNELNGADPNHQGLSTPPSADRTPVDRRVYLQERGWRPLVNETDHHLYCHQMAPGETSFHRISVGEIFLQQGDDVKLCLNCSLSRYVLTRRRPTIDAGSKFLDQTSEDDP